MLPAMAYRKIPDHVRAAIIDTRRAGASYRQVAAQYKVSEETVYKICKVAGLVGTQSDSLKRGTEGRKAATSAKRAWDQAARIELINKGFDKLATMIETLGTDKPSALREWAITTGILIDKRRLEDGDAIDPKETVTDDTRDRLARKLDELDARRRADEVAQQPLG